MHSRIIVRTNTVTPMLLCVCVRSKRLAGFSTSCIMYVPRPSAPMTSAALIQWMSRSVTGQASASSLICQRARLHRDLDRVINQGETKDHAEVRSLYGPDRRKSDRTPLGRWIGFDVYGESNRSCDAEHCKVSADACGARVKL